MGHADMPAEFRAYCRGRVKVCGVGREGSRSPVVPREVSQSRTSWLYYSCVIESYIDNVNAMP